MRSLQIILAVFFTLTMILTIELSLHNYKENMTEHIQENTRIDLKEKSNTLQSEIHHDFTLIYGMEAFISNNFLGDVNKNEIHNFLSTIYQGSDGRVSSLVIAPQGKYEYVYPIKGNEKLLNFEIAKDKRLAVQADLKRAKSTRKIIVSKPYKLIQGHIGIVARKAIYQENQFWGYVSIGLGLSPVLDQAGIIKNSDGIQIAIRSPHEKPFYGTENIFKDPKNVHQSITLPDGYWELAALPNPQEFTELGRQIILFRTVAYLIGFLTLAILAILFTQKERLNREVNTRTIELNKAHAELSISIEEIKESEKELRDQNELLNNYAKALEDSEKKLSHLAFYDQLTGISNRRHFTQALETCLAEESSCGAVIYFDLDNFKIVNDTYGHSTGDILLQSVAKRVAEAGLPLTVFARLGGDEFGIILNNSDLHDARKVADDILQLFQTPFQLPEKMHYVNTSIGISLFDENNRNFQTILKHADITMYNAKRSGGNMVKVFHPTMNQDADQKLMLNNDLRNAVRQNEFVLHYQPQVDSRTGEIIGTEALVRWNHPEKGLLSPAHFISVAEETGFIIELGEWVLRQACTDMKSMMDQGFPAIPLAINLSARQFQDEGLVTKLNRILLETQFPAYLLEFEITERTAMKDEQLSILNEIQQLGINISIDDFGTHYSSLSYLKRFPINKLKIDRSFIKGIQEDDKNLAILRAIISVARDLGIDLIAEGVETEEEAQILRNHDCFHLQGFLFFRPIPFNELIKHVQIGTESSKKNEPLRG